MGLRDIRDLQRAALKYRRAGALDNKNSGFSNDAHRVEASGGDSSISNFLESPLFAEE